jgi:glucose/arabinose dehydrogenase
MLALLAISLAVLAPACKKPPEGRGAGEIDSARGVAASSADAGTLPAAPATGSSTAPFRFRVETFASGLEIPWSIVFAPDGRVFFTERPGRVRVIVGGKLQAKPVATIAEAVQSGESGLMGMTLSPRFSENHLLYLAYAYRDGGEQYVRVASFHESSGTLADQKTLIEKIPSAHFHSGCRLGFGPDGKLYITTGDATRKAQAQDLASLGGKTLRIDEDGSIPQDNPFVGRAGARGEIWSYGQRNSQGLDWQPGTGLLFETEHGPSGNDAPGGGDEVNIIEKGSNYGWPLVHHRATREGMVSPLLEYTPAVAPSGCTFYRGTAIPQLAGNFLFACLRGECLIRVMLNGRSVVGQERLLEHSYGRLRDVVEGPDGALYVATSNRDGRGSPAANDDRILRLVPTP